MNERLALLIGGVTAEVGTSMIWFHLMPDSVFCIPFDDPNLYTLMTAFYAVIGWGLLFAAAWLLGKPETWRRRQRTATKLRLLITLGVLGMIFHAASSLYISTTNEDVIAQAPHSHPAGFSLLGSLGLYALLYSLPIALYTLISAVGRPVTEIDRIRPTGTHD